VITGEERTDVCAQTIDDLTQTAWGAPPSVVVDASTADRGLHARGSPLWYDCPSLVQHRPVASTWGGTPHVADDLSPDWRA
jgi:hypothetical protein